MSAKSLLAHDPSLLSEAQFSGLVVEVARLGGWELRFHTFNSKRSAHGFPDWVFLKSNPPRLLFVELKREGGKLSPKQIAWLDALNDIVDALDEVLLARFRYVDVRVWRPSDWDEIVETLTGRKQRDGVTSRRGAA
jgi:hypothetical protein